MRSETVQLQRTQRDYRRGGRKDTPLWEDKLKEMSRFNEKISAIDRIDVSAYTIPTDFPESDGTFEWDSTTLILVEAHGGGESGLGYTYGDLATASIIKRVLAPAIEGGDAMAVSAAWNVMNRRLRNIGNQSTGHSSGGSDSNGPLSVCGLAA